MRAGDPRQEHLRELHDLPAFDRLEIEHFFLIYKELEPGKSVEGASWADRAAAEGEVEIPGAACGRLRIRGQADRLRRRSTGAEGGVPIRRLVALVALEPDEPVEAVTIDDLPIGSTPWP